MSSSDIPPGVPSPYDPPPPPGAGFGSAPPYGSPQSAAAGARPKLIDFAFWLYIAAAALSVIGLIISIASIGAVREQTLRELDEQGAGIPPEAVEGAIWAGFAVGAVFALIFTAGYVVLAILMRRGFGWARIVLAVLAGLAIFGVVGGFGLGALQFLCLAAATVLVFLPQSNAWFKAAAQNRAAGRA